MVQYSPMTVPNTTSFRYTPTPSAASTRLAPLPQRIVPDRGPVLRRVGAVVFPSGVAAGLTTPTRPHARLSPMAGRGSPISTSDLSPDRRKLFLEHVLRDMARQCDFFVHLDGTVCGASDSFPFVIGLSQEAVLSKPFPAIFHTSKGILDLRGMSRDSNVRCYLVNDLGQKFHFTLEIKRVMIGTTEMWHFHCTPVSAAQLEFEREIRESERSAIARLVNDLISNGTGEALLKTLSLNFARVDLPKGEKMATTVAPFRLDSLRSIKLDPGASLVLPAAAPAFLGDASLVQAVIEHLLFVATTFAAKVNVTVSLGDTPGAVRFAIQDSDTLSELRSWEPGALRFRHGGVYGWSQLIAQRLVEQLGGELSTTAIAAGKLNSFELCFPLAPAEAAEVRRDSVIDPGPLTIAIVDDELIIRKMLQRLNPGAKVFSSSYELQAALDGGAFFNLYILDCNLAVGDPMNGPAIADYLVKKFCPEVDLVTKEQKVKALSEKGITLVGYSSEAGDTRAMFVARGLTAYFTKGSELKELKAFVREKAGTVAASGAGAAAGGSDA